MRYKVTRLFMEFFESERAAGVALFFSALAAMILANSPLSRAFLNLWHIELGWELGGIHLRHSLGHWVNDGLMAVFFLLIGLEIEREFYIGELSDFRNALLPIFAALGGMLLPVAIHFSLNRGLPTQAGFGIPMATDIAFALGALGLLGRRVPLSLKVFLTAFAIIDDLLAILVIVLFYASEFSFAYFALALAVFGVMLFLNLRRVHWIPVYLVLGVVMWYALLQSGIHASIAGVLLAFVIPFGDGSPASPSYDLQHRLEYPVAFMVMPIFALANTGVPLQFSPVGLLSPNALGIFLGLLIGKPLGITSFSMLAARLKIATLPEGIHFRHLLGAGFLGGIGFTMSIFITLLAFGNSEFAQISKIAIMLGSLFAGLIGVIVLRQPVPEEEYA